MRWLRLFSRLIAWMFIFCGGVILLAFLLYRWPLSHPQRSGGKNALWAAHAWVGFRHTEKEYDDLCKLLTQNQISDVFFHVGPLDASGGIRFERYPNASALIKSMRKRCPVIHYQAWMGQKESQGGGKLDLSYEVIRKNIVSTAQKFLDLGFDGIHYNIEPLQDGNSDFLHLLTETRRLTQSQGKILSIASDEMTLFPGGEWLVRRFFRRATLWSKDYYLRLSEQVDQIAVMMYDTALPKDWLYGTLVALETRILIKSLPKDLTLFVGVPTYEDDNRGHHPEAENISSGIRGIQKGLSWVQSSASLGISIYAEWVTDENEWSIYQREWLGLQNESAP